MPDQSESREPCDAAPFIRPDTTVDAPSASAVIKRTSGALPICEKKPPTQNMERPAPQTFNVACEEVLFPGAMQRRCVPTANDQPATLKRWGMGGWGLLFRKSRYQS